MALVAPRHPLFNAETCPSSLHTVRWNDRPLQGPRCQSLTVGPWGTSHAQPGLPRYRCKEQGGPRPCPALPGPLLDGRQRSGLLWSLATLLLGLAWASRRMARELGGPGRPGSRWGWGQRPVALAYALGRQGAGPVAAEDLAPTAGPKGQAKTGGPHALDRPPRGRRQPREPGRGPDDKERLAMIAWVSRHGGGVIHATPVTVKTGQQAAALARQGGSKLSTASASSDRLSPGSAHAAVHQPQQAYARGDVHEKRAAGRLSLLKAYVWACRGVSQTPLPGSGGFLPCLRGATPVARYVPATSVR
jgi:hypothetical protein